MGSNLNSVRDAGLEACFLTPRPADPSGVAQLSLRNVSKKLVMLIPKGAQRIFLEPGERCVLTNLDVEAVPLNNGV